MVVGGCDVFTAQVAVDVFTFKLECERDVGRDVKRDDS